MQFTSPILITIISINIKNKKNIKPLKQHHPYSKHLLNLYKSIAKIKGVIKQLNTRNIITIIIQTKPLSQIGQTNQKLILNLSMKLMNNQDRDITYDWMNIRE